MAASNIPADEQDKITDLMKSYVADFKALSEKILQREAELGFLSDYYAEAEPILNELSQSIGEIAQTQKQRADSIAETSLTVPQMGLVVDFCLRRGLAYDAARNTKALIRMWCSQASAKQRAGRSGRSRRGR